MKFTVGQAARETGKSKSTISRNISIGKISAVKAGNGSYEIDAAELFRVFPRVEYAERKEQSNNVGVGRSATPIELIELKAEVKVLGEQLEREKETVCDLRRQVEREEETVKDLRIDRDQWREEARNNARLLTDQREKEAAAVKSGFWRRVFGG